MKIAIHKEVTIEPTIRTELLSSMFEVPANTKLSVSLSGDCPLESQNWNIGLIVGPSGSGKTLLLNELFGHPRSLEWTRQSVIDDFEGSHSMEDIARVCQSVGFNTIPSYLRPYSVLSNGERFRAEVARRLLDNSNIISIDEFTSVVDRGVAQFACYSIQKYVREKERKLVVASCHYDILDWLQPDWILEPGNPCRFTWRSLQPRPQIACQVSRCKYETWELFREFHYMSQDLNKAARCYGLYVSTTNTTGMDLQIHNENIRAFPDGIHSNRGTDPGLRIRSEFGMRGHRHDSEVVLRSDKGGAYDESAKPFLLQGESSISSEQNRRGCESNEAVLRRSVSNEQISLVSLRRPGQTYRIASLCGVLYRPHPKVSDIMGFTRMVTLPDFQGLGLAFVLANTVASAYKALGFRLHSYPNHPAWIRSYQRSKNWMQVKEAGSFSPRRGESSTVGGFGGRRCAVFQYIGDAMNKEEAERLINADKTQ